MTNDTEKVLENEKIRVSIQLATLKATILEKTSGITWNFTSNADYDLCVHNNGSTTNVALSNATQKSAESISRDGSDGVLLKLTGLPCDVTLNVNYFLHPVLPQLTVEITPEPESDAAVGECRFPGPLQCEGDSIEYTVWPAMHGCLIPKGYRRAIDTLEGAPGGLAFTRGLYMPWWGQVGKKSAYIAISETPYDFKLHLHHTEGGETTTRPIWITSHGKFSYPRRIRYNFLPGADYVALAKEYRRYAMEIRRFRSLREKIDTCPNVGMLLGSIAVPITICTHNTRRDPVDHRVWSFVQRTQEMRDLRKKVKSGKVFIHVDGWGRRGYDNLHPDILPPCPEAGGWDGLVEMSHVADELGFLFGLHDQYRDYYHDADTYSEARCVKNAQGEVPYINNWAGGPQSVLCAREAVKDIRRNFTELRNHNVTLTASYLDVFAIVPMDECYDPNHPMTRSECQRYRAEGLDYVRSLDIAISSEEPVDCFIPNLDFCYWAPYYQWNGLFSGPYLGIPVPLYSLVYHDAIFVPWNLGSVDKYTTAQQRWLHCLLHAGIPYCGITDSEEILAKQMLLAKVHGTLGLDNLTNHSLLAEDGSIQEFEYESGGRIWANLKTGEYQIQGVPGVSEDVSQLEI